MKITGTAIKLGIFSLVLLLFTAMLIVVFGQMRFDRTTGYSAIFSNTSGLRTGQFVRASGVEVGKVSKTSASIPRCSCSTGRRPPSVT
jgi:phospholipid/cholesterol/gamma-HCH transport system substrate-binding protein